jgi:transcriptional regulator with XRE-family HTH domain
LAADGFSQREIAERLGINRRTVARLARRDEPPRYRRAAAGSQLDPLEPVLRWLLSEWPAIKAPRLTEILRDEYGYSGSVRLVPEPAAIAAAGGACGVRKLCSHRGIIPICRRNRVLTRNTDDAERLRA